MAFDYLKEHTENIQEHTKEFIEKNIEYYKLSAFKMAMKSTTMIFKFILILLCICMVLLFLSIALAFIIGSYLGSYALGFLSVGLLYLVCTGLLFLVKDKIVEGPILEKFSEIFFNE
ncbi:phage holin family protein [Flavobacterium daejeonense]|uniref:phage holin family protein n=1 Tax=Flavobacterium daejeonense TaxID=350893 RepID=UPI00047AB090|nr:phage holin family protein [Flavobacterium daejeonense]